MNSQVDDATTNASFLPFGYEGPIRFKSFKAGGEPGLFNSGSSGISGSYNVANSASLFVSNARNTPDNSTRGAGTGSLGLVFSIGNPAAGEGTLNINSLPATTMSFAYPMIPLRPSSLAGNLSSPQDAYFGISTNNGTSPRYEPAYEDLVRAFPEAYSSYGSSTNNDMERAYIFTLEDLTRYTGSVAATETLNPSAALMTSTTDAYYASGSRAQGNSLSVTSSNTWNNVLAAGFDSFTVPLQGGFNGLDITEANPFRNSQFTTGADTELTNYAFNSIKMAVDTCSDPEVVECNMMTMPGLTNTALTEHIIKTCEDRADSLAIIDIENGYVPPDENSQSEEQRAGNVTDAATALQQRGLNSSYGCCYYPWIQARDSETGNTFWCPPSVAAIGTFSSAQQKSELWFAPAGFNRGGLTEGSAGIPVVNVKQKLTSKQRDLLYEANINPIASFPAEGIVIFGQKTLQTTPSALDRINVRRLMIYVKKEISRISNLLLFDQNVQATWDRFTGQVVPFLNSIRSRLGLEDFKVILDETTTTPDLIDRNIMYAKIFLKPARSIEFIAIDFVITSTGASFED